MEPTFYKFFNRLTASIKEFNKENSLKKKYIFASKGRIWEIALIKKKTIETLNDLYAYNWLFTQKVYKWSVMLKVNIILGKYIFLWNILRSSYFLLSTEIVLILVQVSG